MSPVCPGDQDLWQAAQEHVERPQTCHVRSAVPSLEEPLGAQLAAHTSCETIKLFMDA